MSFSLKQFLGFVALISAAIALSRLLPLLSVLVVITCFLAAYFLMDFTKWKLVVCFTMLGIGIFPLTFLAITWLVSPPETLGRVKGSSPHRKWMEHAVLYRNYTAVPMGALLGVLTFFGHLWLQWARQLQIWDVGPKSLAIAGGIAVFSGFLPAILFSIRHVYTFGNMIVYEFVGTNGQYPTDPDRLFSIQLTTKMFAISYPLLILTLIAVLFLSLSVAARRRRRRLATEGGVE
ncbi:MAG: hypothetical protein ABL888_03430 [Pirellulaceae bacterium]